MAHQPPGSIQYAVAGMTMEYGGQVVSNGSSNVQLLSVTVPSDALYAVIEFSSSTSPIDTETKWIRGQGSATINFSNNQLTYIYSVFGSDVSAGGNNQVTLSTSGSGDLLPTTLVHYISIKNYGGGPGGLLQIYADDTSTETGNAADHVSVEFITS